MLERNPKTVKLVFKNFPLRMHKYARKASAAALAAQRQGKFWEFHDRLFASYKSLDDRKVREIARQLGLDEQRLLKDMQDPQVLQQIEKDLRGGVAAGVRGTPTLFVNGRKVKNRSLEGFQSLIDRELKR